MSSAAPALKVVATSSVSSSNGPADVHKVDPTVVLPQTRLQCYIDPLLTIWQALQTLRQTLKEVPWSDILFVNRWKSKWFGNTWKVMTMCGENWEAQRKDIYSGARGVVLEIGPGTGSSARFYPPAATGLISHIYLVEPNSKFYPLLRERYAALGYTESSEINPTEPSFTLIPSFFTPDFNQPPDCHPAAPSDGTIDTIICMLVLCTIPETAAACRKVYDLLKPGGQLRIFEHVQSEDRVTRAVQWFYNLVWGVPFDGCNLGRPTDEHMFKAGDNGDGWKVFEREHLEGESRYTTLPTYYGRCIKK